MTKHESFDVGVIMGSDSDLKIMKHASDILEHFSVPHEVRILSAHRTPEKASIYARSAAKVGLKVIIAGAGGSAHLPGVIAAETRLPVLGVAIETSPDSSNCAIGSMIGMPKGIPLATMGKNAAAATNAGLEAVRILALCDEKLGEAYDSYVANLAEDVNRRDAHLQQIGANLYLEQICSLPKK